MIPLKDDNPRTSFPIVNIIFIIANVLVFINQALFMTSQGEQEFIFRYGAIPSLITSGDQLSTLFTSMFLHGGFMHIAGNMLYLYIFGDNIENLMGSVKYAAFYILCGIGATLAHIIVSPGSEYPLVGASGAISGVLGAYAISFPRARVLVLIPIIFFFTTVRIPAIFVLGIWFIIQLFSGLTSFGSGGIAWFAHIGGFVIGVALVRLFRRRPPPQFYEYDDDQREW